MPTKPVKIYTTRTCGYCHAAVRLLTNKGISFEQIDVTGAPDMREWLESETGRSTVPQIFIGDDAIGGYTDLAALDNSGKLAQMLQS
jgi:glutaredoxin 3